jgi:hypothetical protein
VRPRIERTTVARIGALSAALFVLACSCGGSDGAPPAFVPLEAGADADASTAPFDAGGEAGAESAAAGASVVVRGGQLVVDGAPMFLYGGEIHYFRVRDPGMDAVKTKALWQDSIDKMKAAHMNLVTTYLPWDYHATGSGTWDFAGPRDVDAFLQIACDAGMKVVAKPGPLITSEWPRGFGTYGAVPQWWKDAFPDALVKKADGSTFTFSPTGDMTQAQPTYLDPRYLAAVGGWFDQVLPIVRKYIDRRCVVGVQVDNETNLYWSNRFGDVDYNPVAVAHYRQFLTTRYAAVAALNAAYGTSYASFADVVPPSALPAATKDNVAARDWYEAGLAYVLDYLKTIRGMLEARGVHEPDVLFLTNDSPFGVPTRNVLVHDGQTKNQVGLAGLDLYPKQFPTNGEVSDQPYQVDYFTKLYAGSNLLYTKDTGGRFAWGAELQGGFYSFPLGVKPNVRPEATDQLLAKAIGHGLKGGSFYTMRGGINLDGSDYDFQAAIGTDGTLRPRYDVMKKWGAFLGTWGLALEGSDEVEDPVAIVQDARYAVPQAGTNDDVQAMYVNEYPGLFGWLHEAGLNPAVVEAQTTSDLSAFKVVFYLLPKLVAKDTAAKLTKFHDGGGTLVLLLDRGTTGLDGAASPEVQKLAALFDADASGSYAWPGVGLRSGDANQKLAGATGTTKTYWYETFWTPKAASFTPLVVERNQPLGGDGRVVAWEVTGDGASRALLGGYVSSIYNDSGYYGADAADLERKRALATHLVGTLGGTTGAVSATGLREAAWARRGRGDKAPTFLFVTSGHDAGTVHVDIHALARLGLFAPVAYTLTEGLTGTALGTRTGADLASQGLSVSLPAYGTAVVVVQQ